MHELKVLTWELHDYYMEYLSSLRVTDLKEISKNAGLRTTLKKQELVDQILDKGIVKNIPLPFVKNIKFDEMMFYFFDVYINDIRKQIDKWHPYYIEAVWLEVQGNMTADDTHLEISVNDIIKEKYWENRITMDSI